MSVVSTSNVLPLRFVLIFKSSNKLTSVLTSEICGKPSIFTCPCANRVAGIIATALFLHH